MKRHASIALRRGNLSWILATSVLMTLTPITARADRIVVGEEFMASW
jgi:hypothetical protein